MSDLATLIFIFLLLVSVIGFTEISNHFDRYACPLCSKSVCDMSKVWEKYDMEIAATPVPEPYLNKMVSLLNK